MGTAILPSGREAHPFIHQVIRAAHWLPWRKKILTTALFPEPTRTISGHLARQEAGGKVKHALTSFESRLRLVTEAVHSFEERLLAPTDACTSLSTKLYLITPSLFAVLSQRCGVLYDAEVIHLNMKSMPVSKCVVGTVSTAFDLGTFTACAHHKPWTNIWVQGG